MVKIDRSLYSKLFEKNSRIFDIVHHHICLSFAPIISPHHCRMRSSLRPPPIAPSPPYKSIFVHPSGHSPDTPSSTSSSPPYPPPSPPSVYTLCVTPSLPISFLTRPLRRSTPLHVCLCLQRSADTWSNQKV